jgi:DNA repair protein RadC
MTHEIITVAKPPGIAVHDHIIVGQDEPQGAEADLRCSPA